MIEQEMIDAIQAHIDGKVIQTRSICRPDKEWLTCKRRPLFNFEHCDYRVKPHPLDCWCNIYDGVIAMHNSKEAAIENVGITAIRRAVHMVEKSEDEG